MSLLAHALLIAALALGVSWRTEDPAGVEAELWAATPQLAAPRAEPDTTPPPEPTPVTRMAPPKPVPTPPLASAERDAQIAVEKAARERKDKERREAEDQRAREKREQTERDRKDKAEADRQTKLKAEVDDKRKQAAEKAEQQKRDKADDARKAAQQEKAADAQREKLRQEQMRRMNDQLGGTGAAGSSGTAARDAGPSASYGGRIKARIKPNIVLTDDVPGNPVAEVEVRVAPDGTVIGRRILTSSGVKAWDDTVLRAIDRTGTLPRDTDGRIPSTMVISFRPQE